MEDVNFAQLLAFPIARSRVGNFLPQLVKPGVDLSLALTLPSICLLSPISENNKHNLVEFFLYWKQKGVCRFIWSSLYEEVSTCSFRHSAALALGLFSLDLPHRHPHPSWCSGAYTCTFNNLSVLDVIFYEIIKTIHFTYFIGTISIKKTQNFELIPHLAKSPASPPPSIRSISFSGGRRKTQLCWNPHSPRFWLLLLGCDLFWCLLATGAHHP